MITNITDWGLSLKASSESKDFFMHNIIATIKAALGCHDTDLLDIFHECKHAVFDRNRSCVCKAGSLETRLVVKINTEI